MEISIPRNGLDLDSMCYENPLEQPIKEVLQSIIYNNPLARDGDQRSHLGCSASISVFCVKHTGEFPDLLEAMFNAGTGIGGPECIDTYDLAVAIRDGDIEKINQLKDKYIRSNDAINLNNVLADYLSNNEWKQFQDTSFMVNDSYPDEYLHVARGCDDDVRDYQVYEESGVGPDTSKPPFESITVFPDAPKKMLIYNPYKMKSRTLRALAKVLLAEQRRILEKNYPQEELAIELTSGDPRH